jgi:ferredoxin
MTFPKSVLSSIGRNASLVQHLRRGTTRQFQPTSTQSRRRLLYPLESSIQHSNQYVRVKDNNHRHHQRQQCRTFARTSNMEPDSPAQKAKNFVIQIGHDPKIAQGVVDALMESGMSGSTLLSTVRTMAGRWEVGEDAGLETLVESVKLSLARSEGRTAITIWCVPAGAWKSSEQDQADFSAIHETPHERQEILTRAFRIEAMTGLTLTDVAKFGDGVGASELGESIECACAGIMACSTCHVVIDPEWFDKVGEASEAEQDMLDLAYAPRASSRLACQIVLEDSMDGMVIRLPRGANNLMDHIPFE